MTQDKKRKGPLQTVLSMVILSILMVICVGIWFVQFRYNPAVLQKEAFLPEPNKNKSSSQLSPNAYFVPLPEGIKPLTPAETFDAHNLSDKINGKAELYLSAGFTGLVSQRFKNERSADLWMEAFVYNMANRQNAFSVFSTQRRKDATSLNLAQNAYRTSNALFLTHGPYYVEIIASKASENLLKPVEIMAETVIKNTPSETVTLNESALFPEEGRVKNSIALIASNAFGFDGFDKIYIAEYEFDDHSLMAYLSHRKTPGEAEEMASAYAKFLLAYGGKNIVVQVPVEGARVIEILDTYELFFTHGSYLAGIREASSIDQAQMLAIRLYDRLKEVGDAPSEK